MIKILLDFGTFLFSCVPLLTSLAFFALSGVLLAKLIKRHARLFYLVAAVPSLLVAVPTILRWCGVETAGFTGIPVLGQVLRDYIHMGTFGHPLLIVIMYTGALDPKIPFVKRLMSIRKELSILSGFPVLTHSLIRVAGSLPGAVSFFADRDGYMAATNAVSEPGAGVSSFSFVLGVVMLALFLSLCITSFPAIQRRMGAVKWKKLQKWSYVFYAALFLHAMGIQVGGMLNPRVGAAPQPSVEALVAGSEVRPVVGGARSERPSAAAEGRSENVRATQQTGNSTRTTVQGRRMAKGFADIKVAARTRQWLHVGSLLLIYGSYLYRKHSVKCIL